MAGSLPESDAAAGVTEKSRTASRARHLGTTLVCHGASSIERRGDAETGVMARYAALVSSAARGAITDPRLVRIRA